MMHDVAIASHLHRWQASAMASGILPHVLDMKRWVTFGMHPS